MTRLIIVGQAPSRVGDGRAFTGPSGTRLVKLFGLEDYEQLAAQVTLTNIFGSPQARSRAILCGKRKHAGDEWDSDLAQVEGFGLILTWYKDPEPKVVLACGANVTEALLGERIDQYTGRKVAPNLDIWRFPHPSGASHYWNSPDNQLDAQKFIVRLLKRYGINIA